MITGSPRSWLTLCTTLVLFAALGSVGQAAWLTGKAWLAQKLLQQAWQQGLITGSPVKPLSWADMRSVARLDIPAAKLSLVVLDEASGEAMAFGPGLMGGDPLRAAVNTLALGGHRDTHMAFLEHLDVGQLISLDTLDGLVHRYRLSDRQIVDTRHQSLRIATDSPGLVLVTCYPFSALQTGGPLRFVARATYLDSAVTL